MPNTTHLKWLTGPSKILCNITVILCSCIVAVMVVTTIIDTFCRYVFNMPIPGVIEFNETMFPALVFLGLAYTQKEKGHIRVTALLERLGTSAQRNLNYLALILAIVVAVVIGVKTWEAAMYSHMIQEEYWAPIETFTLYIWPVRFAVSLGFWILAFQCLVDIAELAFCPAGKSSEGGGQNV